MVLLALYTASHKHPALTPLMTCKWDANVSTITYVERLLTNECGWDLSPRVVINVRLALLANFFGNLRHALGCELPQDSGWSWLDFLSLEVTLVGDRGRGGGSRLILLLALNHSFCIVPRASALLWWESDTPPGDQRQVSGLSAQKIVPPAIVRIQCPWITWHNTPHGRCIFISEMRGWLCGAVL